MPEHQLRRARRIDWSKHKFEADHEQDFFSAVAKDLDLEPTDFIEMRVVMGRCSRERLTCGGVYSGDTGVHGQIKIDIQGTLLEDRQELCSSYLLPTALTKCALRATSYAAQVLGIAVRGIAIRAVATFTVQGYPIGAADPFKDIELGIDVETHLSDDLTEADRDDLSTSAQHHCLILQLLAKTAACNVELRFIPPPGRDNVRRDPFGVLA